MSFFKDLMRGMMGGHHGGSRYGGHHGRYYRDYEGPSVDDAPGVACPKCRAVNAAKARFCQECGTPLTPAKCASCGADIAPAAKFCPNCGKQASPS